MTDKFYQLSPNQRLETLKKLGLLTESEKNQLLNSAEPEMIARSDQWIENCIGCFPIPFGIVPDCTINGITRILPLAVEETSIIAGLNKINRWVQQSGGSLTATSQPAIQVGQLFCPHHPQPTQWLSQFSQQIPKWIDKINQHCLANLCRRGGGVKRITCHQLPNEPHQFILHLHCHTVDAMGANLINQASEYLKQQLSTSAHFTLAILSNLMTEGLTQATMTLPNIDPSLGQTIEQASRLAEQDPYRATTSNKGMMNAMEAIALATGNDWRALSSGLHSYAALSGQYRSLSRWRYHDHTLVGTTQLPIQMGTVGGVTRTHPLAKLSLKWMKAPCRQTASEVMATAGLMQNCAALNALCQEGIIQGHMRLQIQNILLAIGSTGQASQWLEQQLITRLNQKQTISESMARSLLTHYVDPSHSQ